VTSAWVPGRVPPQLDLSGQVYNPQGVLPAPFPRDIASQAHNGSTQTLQFSTAGLPAGVYGRAFWESPVYNLRPYLGALQTSGVVGDSNVQGTNDIWLPAGATGKLWVHISNLLAVDWSTAGLRVYSTEYAALMTSTDLVDISTPQDITAELIGGASSALATFLPPGQGYPVAFYRLRLTFDYVQNNTALAGWPYPKIQVRSAYY
jgi:hypothetical protein